MDKEIVGIVMGSLGLVIMFFVIYTYIRDEISEKKHYEEYKANGYSYSPNTNKAKLEKRKNIIKKILKDG